MDRTGTSQSREINSPTRIAAGLLGSDRTILAPLLILGAVPGFIEVAQPWLDDRQVFLFAALRQLVAMVVICLIARRWIVRLRREVRPIPVTAFIGATLTGFGLWLLFSIPPLLPLIDPRPEMRFFGVIVAIPAVIVAWRYLLLPVSLLLGIRGTRAQLTFARELTREDPLLPLRILIPPLSIKVTLLALLAAFSPTGRSAFVTSCGPLVSAVVPLLSGYLALGFIVHRLGERRWNELGLDPYRQARTATIIVQGPGWLARALQIGPALVILSLGILVQLGNLARLAGAPVPVDVVVSAVSLSDDQASVTIRITDSSARFRGFTPAAFFLASDTGFAITRRPERATLSGDDRDVRYRFPRDQDHAEVTLVFSTRRPALEMQKLEDIHLWYGGNRLERLVLKDAPIELPAQGSPPPAPSPP